MGELMHYGVKGMKWGVRKDRKVQGTPTMPTKGHVVDLNDHKNVNVMNSDGKVFNIRKKDLPRTLVDNYKYVGGGGVSEKLYTELYNELSEDQLDELEELAGLEEVFNELEEEQEDLKEELYKSLTKEEKQELKDMKKELNNEYEKLSPEQKELIGKVKDAIPGILPKVKKSAQGLIRAKYQAKSFIKSVKKLPSDVKDEIDYAKYKLDKKREPFKEAKEARKARKAKEAKGVKEKKGAKKGLTNKTTINTAKGKSLTRTPVKKKKSKNFLKHYGVKGMKWGVRKARPTSGKRRGKTNAQRIYEHVTRKKETPQATTKTSSQPVKRRVSDMSDEELRTAINRMQMERTYAQLTAKEVSKGQKFVKEVLYNSAKTVAGDLTKEAMKKAVKKLQNSSNSSGGGP